MELLALISVEFLTRKQVVPHYAQLISSDASSEEVVRVNNLILSKWSPSGLLYIKDLAWKMAYDQRAAEYNAFLEAAKQLKK